MSTIRRVAEGEKPPATQSRRATLAGMAGLSTGRPSPGRDSQGVIRGLGPLVGRSKELAAIQRFVDSAGGSIVFSGPAGAGKTRLIGEVERRATEAGYVCLRVVASQFASPVTATG